MSEVYQFKISERNRKIFEAIKIGRKKVETRAATVRYKDIIVGDRVMFTCGKDCFERVIGRVTHFASVDEMLTKYKVEDIDPTRHTADELKHLYASFPDYGDKIEKVGIIALEI